MTGRYLTDMASWLRAAGLTVIEEPGWQTRARSSGGFASGRPWCIMWHHTASQSTPENDVSYIINADTAPISNLYLARDGSIHVIAAGATNTNGQGGPLAVSLGTVPTDKMNEYAVSIEAANSGVGEVWPQVQVDAFFTASIALTNALGLQPDDICSHRGWTTRKIDPATAAAVQGPWKPRSENSSGTWNLADMRAECVRRAGSPPPIPPKPGDDDMQVRLLTLTDSDAQFLAETDSQGQALFITWAGPGSPAVDQAVAAHRAEAQRKGHQFEQQGNLAGIFNCVGIGTKPYGDSRHNWTGSECWRWVVGD